MYSCQLPAGMQGYFVPQFSIALLSFFWIQVSKRASKAPASPVSIQFEQTLCPMTLELLREWSLNVYEKHGPKHPAVAPPLVHHPCTSGNRLAWKAVDINSINKCSSLIHSLVDVPHHRKPHLFSECSPYVRQTGNELLGSETRNPAGIHQGSPPLRGAAVLQDIWNYLPFITRCG